MNDTLLYFIIISRVLIMVLEADPQ